VSQPTVAAPPALRTLVSELVDYAGLFPPAALNMADAVARYASYRLGPDAWMLGRFVLPIAQLDAWTESVAALTEPLRAPWSGARISGLMSGEFGDEARRLESFNAERPFGVHIDVVEGRTPTTDSICALVAAVPDDVTVYCEIPHREDPLVLLRTVRATNARAKIRTGGVVPDAFPTPHEIIRFLRQCHESGVTAKATAGLHHPLRGEFPLTYAPDSVRGTMYGFLNVLLAAAAIRRGASDAVARAVLVLSSKDALEMTDAEVTITLNPPVDGTTSLVIPAHVIADTRVSGVVAFGSCSFREPVDEFAQLLSA
jgi:hypothetical protein